MRRQTFAAAAGHWRNVSVWLNTRSMNSPPCGAVLREQTIIVFLSGGKMQTGRWKGVDTDDFRVLGRHQNDRWIGHC